MDLILWRHADAESGIPDEARRLTAKGRKQAERMAAWLGKRLPEHYVVLASPARRAQETAHALARKVETRVELGTLSTPQAILEIAKWPDAEQTVVVVGHQPTLGQAAALALTGSVADWNVRKAAVWWLARRDREKPFVRAVMGPDLL
ncbi:MAG TPA: histidine phosphatase family protein [Burkholderiales bacterium]|nr:histidine phosphatase family protein [Burkholderiales bacterium]